MKNSILFLFLLFLSFTAFSQTKVSILGDSYSTFTGHISPQTNEPWYPRSADENDVTEVEQTWWRLLIDNHKDELVLEKNNSYSGATISCHGYNNADYSHRSYITRSLDLGNPDMILIFGATNDSWAGAPMGEYKFSDWTKSDIFFFRPAMAMLLSQMKTLYPRQDIYFILNSELKDEINESICTICRNYSVPVITLKDIDKQAGHPSQQGMKSIAEQVWSAIKKVQPKYIALSFDDGPNTVTTPKVLDVLEENGVTASFFVNGKYLDNEENIAVMQRAVALGCDIQNHSYSHYQMGDFEDEALINEEIDKTSALIEKYAGKKPEFFRPPYINHSELMHKLIDLTFICGRSFNDWDPGFDADARINAILTTVIDGDILLLHDMQGNDATVEALKVVIPELKKRGFVFVTVPQLFKEVRGSMPETHSGIIYSNIFD
ncbi:MAG: SGNH/GDSL hydrolase family protein [Desulfobacter postgatei]|jgi:peptidoglycan/xylan/chitin deacetylase (PgdA/CDA1 family)|uniref:SGNH/GDSL hydrolase family protein n=1 Tax=Desulfobacter postgatei TaxID=2293 RepID=UPI0023F53416|nr:SGNH/GDSL hydrolase family protein [Desulfobacter postgatei]MDD4275177.1 SGNH/GDSL hydrolase family protein [Desulfobacter postgatei]